jgi:hypothetical protein
MRIDIRAWLRLPLPTQALGLLVVGLVSCIVAVILRGTQAATLLATPANPAAAFELDLSSPRQSPDLAAMQIRPLVHSSRAFYQKPAEAPPAAPPRPDYRLAGALMLPGKAPVAVVVDRIGNHSRRVKVGDELDGWQVASVDRKRVLLTWGAERAEITSGTFTPAATSVASTNASGGLKRVPLARQQVAAASGAVQSLGASGNAPVARGVGGPVDDTPRLYRPPPQ